MGILLLDEKQKRMIIDTVNHNMAKIEMEFRNLAILREHSVPHKNFSYGATLTFCDRKRWEHRMAWSWSFNPQFHGDKFPIFIGKEIDLVMEYDAPSGENEVSAKFKVIGVISNTIDEMTFRVRPVGFKKRLKHFLGIYPWWR